MRLSKNLISPGKIGTVSKNKYKDTGPRLKSHESPRATGRNNKSTNASARLHQLKKRLQLIRKALQQNP